jgi:hypothetical protein
VLDLVDDEKRKSIIEARIAERRADEEKRRAGKSRKGN